MKIYIENQTHDTKDGAHHMPLHTQETRQKRAICVRFGEKISGGGGCFFLREGVARGAMFLLSRRGGGHWHGGSIGMGGGGGWRCCPVHLNSCPTSTRTIKNPLPWKKKVMWK